MFILHVYCQLLVVWKPLCWNGDLIMTMLQRNTIKQVWNLIHMHQYVFKCSVFTATCFRNAKSWEQCKDCLMKAADCHKQNRKYPLVTRLCVVHILHIWCGYTWRSNVRKYLFEYVVHYFIHLIEYTLPTHQTLNKPFYISHLQCM